ncbi:MAG: thiamine pyrophosphate-binding protein [Desulfarculus sp.]|nr:thiamine pyrophosphate-binding protein [Desulfarculus sp.]
MPPSDGHHKLLEQMRADQVSLVFGNPGTSEEGLLNAMQDFPDIAYIMSLQESVALAMADGYCRAGQRAGVVLLHSGVGLGNAVGLMYQAKRGHSPLVVLAGEAGVAYSALEAQMACDLVAMVRPVTKHAARVEHPASLLRMFRRAFKEALTPPFGPVFLALPQDILDAPNDEPVIPTLIPDTRAAPRREALAEAARVLAAARKPLVLMGDGVARSGAQEALARLAEALGAQVFGVNNSEVNLPQGHPLFGGNTGHMFGPDSAKIVGGADAVLIVGTYVFPEVFPLLASPFAPGAAVIHIELDAHEIAKNHPCTMALVADPRTTLAALADCLAETASPEHKQAARQRAEALARVKASQLAETKAQDQKKWQEGRPRISALAEALARRLPADAIIFDEALTNSGELTRWLPADRPGQFFQTRGGSLGVGFPGAMGAKLAWPGRTVIGFSGDGGSMYTAQAFWSAAHHGIGAKFVVINNGGYRLLKLNLLQYWKDLGMAQGSFPWNFSIEDPTVDYVGLARSMGVPGLHVDTRQDIEPAVESMLSGDGPFLLSIEVDGSV